MDVKYPKKYRKVTPKILAEMKRLHKQGLRVAEIARRLNLSFGTVKRKLDPVAHEKALESTRKHLKKYMKDPNYRKKINEKLRQNCNKRYHSDPEYRKFLINYSKKYNVNT